MPKKITVVVNGRFHAFDYAAELQKRGMLHRLISSMPYSIAKRFGIKREKYIGMPYFEFAKYCARKFFKRPLPTVDYAKIFTKIALLFIPKDTDIIISFAGYSKEIFESLAHKKALKILDRGSTHTLANISLLRLAAHYHQVEFTPHPDEFIERELLEYQYADMILTPSSFVAKTFLENGIDIEKILVIPYAFSTKKFAGLQRDIISIPCKYILFVGQVSIRKGIGVLINAMRLVIKKYPEYRLCIVGSLQSNIDPNILKEKWIDYKGVLSGKSLFDVYASATAFCLPSFEEGLALVLTEALHFNLPIIATPNTGVESLKIKEDQLYLAPVGDHDLLGEKIMECILALDKSQNEKKVVPMNNSWESFTNQLINNINDSIKI